MWSPAPELFWAHSQSQRAIEIAEISIRSLREHHFGRIWRSGRLLRFLRVYLEPEKNPVSVEKLWLRIFLFFRSYSRGHNRYMRKKSICHQICHQNLVTDLVTKMQYYEKSDARIFDLFARRNLIGMIGKTNGSAMFEFPLAGLQLRSCHQICHQKCTPLSPPPWNKGVHLWRAVHWLGIGLIIILCI